jgi:hypothetical protein
MPKQLTRNIYKCILCEQIGINKEFLDEDAAKHHEEYDHDIVWLGIERSDLNRLLNFIATNEKNQEFLTERLMKTLQNKVRPY